MKEESISIDFVYPGYPQSIIHIKGDISEMVQSERLIENLNHYNFINIDKNQLIEELANKKAGFIKNNVVYFFNHNLSNQLNRDIALVSYFKDNKTPSVLFFQSGQALKNHIEGFAKNSEDKYEVYLFNEKNFKISEDVLKHGKLIISSDILQLYLKFKYIEENRLMITNVGLQYELSCQHLGEKLCINNKPTPPFLIEAKNITDLCEKFKHYSGPKIISDFSVYKIKPNKEEADLICKASLLPYLNLGPEENINKETDKYQTQRVGYAIKNVVDTEVSYQLFVTKQDLEKCSIYKRGDKEFYNLSLKVIKNPINNTTHDVVDSLYHKWGVEDIFDEEALLIEKDKILNHPLDANITCMVKSFDKAKEKLKQDFKVYNCSISNSGVVTLMDMIGTGLHINHGHIKVQPSSKVNTEKKNQNPKSHKIPSVETITSEKKNNFRGNVIS